MIGILDSGMGGLSTLAALVKGGCDRAFCYYADVANAPYGNKPADEVVRAVMGAVKALVERGADKVVLACNTATLVASDRIRCTIKIPIYGVIPPVEEATRKGGKTLLLATALTCRNYKNRADFLSLAMPELATIIDRDYPDTDVIETYCEKQLEDMGQVDNLVLGCTHYVLIEDILRRITKAKRVFDGNNALMKSLGKSANNTRKWTVDYLSSGEIDIARYREVTRLLCRRG